MILNLRKEQFSYAYVHAVCASAGFDYVRKPVDNDSVDVQIMSDRKLVRRAPKIELQVKCTSRVELREEDFSIALPRNNYDDLRDPHVFLPRILVVVLVPKDREEWLAQGEDYATLKHCGYWHSLRDAPDPKDPEQGNVTVRIRRDHVFTVAALSQMMHRISAGGMP
jgi:hypothetical protein